MNLLAKITGRHKEIGVSRGAIPKILNLKGKNPKPDPCAQFWYHCMTRAQATVFLHYFQPGNPFFGSSHTLSGRSAPCPQGRPNGVRGPC